MVMAQLARASDAVVAFDEEALRRCMSALLPTYRWETGNAAQTAEVLPMQRGSGSDTAA
jgi:hypothetical protein